MSEYRPSPRFPNWSDPSAYPDDETFRDSEDSSNYARGWAWEFLRRNPAYQEDYDRALNGDNASQEEVAAKYGLSLLLPYSYSGSECLAMFKNILALRELDSHSLQFPHFTETQVAFVFDVTLPLQPQWEAAKAQIAEKADRLGLVLQERSDGRKRYGNYPRYLRVLDARANNIRSKEIAELFIREGLFPSEGLSDYVKQIDKYYERATELSCSGYLRIAYTSD